MDFLYIKALHIIVVVTWFSGLFYMVRLFVYQSEANEKDEPEKSILVRQFKLMQKRLWYGITWPSAILTCFFGTWMLLKNPSYYLTSPWMLIKLFLVGLLLLYHCLCHMIFKRQQADVYREKSLRLRIWNELATLFLVAIVFLVVLKSRSGFIWGVLGLIVFAALLMIAIQIYRKMRKKGEGMQADNVWKNGEKKDE